MHVAYVFSDADGGCNSRAEALDCYHSFVIPVWSFGLSSLAPDTRPAVRYNPPNFYWRWSIAKEAEARPALSPDRLDAGRRFAIEAARLAANTRCHEVIVMEVAGISPVTDFFVVATGTSPRQMRTVAEDLEEMGRPIGYRPFSRTDYESDNWILIDFVDVIVHVFNEDARRYYDLEGLWGDAPRVEWRDGQP